MLVRVYGAHMIAKSRGDPWAAKRSHGGINDQHELKASIAHSFNATVESGSFGGAHGLDDRNHLLFTPKQVSHFLHC